jgi:hydroxymethylpyrimidine pyrophosphatase-like HAD family hydrolase
VEVYKDGKLLSFMTAASIKKLNALNKQHLFIPVTSRSLEQYNRIKLGFTPKYGVIENGARLITDGVIDSHWGAETARLLSRTMPLIPRLFNVISSDFDRYYVSDVRIVEDYFVFGKWTDTVKCDAALRGVADDTLFDIFTVGNKFYIMPKLLSKGTATNRIRQFLNGSGNRQKIIAAGDSPMDTPMLKAADIPYKAVNGQCAEAMLDFILNLKT